MNATQQTKEVKKILTGLIVKVRTDVCGSMIAGHSDELLRAKARLVAAGFTCLNMGNFLGAAID